MFLTFKAAIFFVLLFFPYILATTTRIRHTTWGRRPALEGPAPLVQESNLCVSDENPTATHSFKREICHAARGLPLPPSPVGSICNVATLI